MRIAVLVKQVPRFENMQLGPDGRLVRDGLELEMNPYCRRAVAKGVELARAHAGTCTVLTLGPPTAEDSLREAVAWGADDAVLVTDRAFAGSDTLATARALATALDLEGPWDLVLAGRNSVDADTGQVGPEIAELLDLPFLAGAKQLELAAGRIEALCEHDDGFVRATARLPAVVSCAERLCAPAKAPPEGRAAVPAERVRLLSAAELGDGPWGQDGSPTRVGRVEVLQVDRTCQVLSGTVAEQVAEAVAIMQDRGALRSGLPPQQPPERVGPWRPLVGPALAVAVEPGRSRTARALLGAAAGLAPRLGGHVVAVTFGDRAEEVAALSAAGADAVVSVPEAEVEEDAAAGLVAWAREAQPWAVLGPGTMWGREVCSRAAARLGAGLTGDAVELAIEDGRLVGWKPAFGGALVAAVTAESPIQMVTVRPGVLPVPEPRVARVVPASRVHVVPRGRVQHLAAERDDELDALAVADAVVGVGSAVQPDEYELLGPLLDVLGAELGATRKVTDRGWLPRARQIGITGRSIGPRLYVAVGLSGKFNHMVGVRGAGFVLAVNDDPTAPVFAAADVGIVGDWHEVVAALHAALSGVTLAGA